MLYHIYYTKIRKEAKASFFSQEKQIDLRGKPSSVMITLEKIKKGVGKLKMDPQKILIVTPVYNEEKNLPYVIEDLKKYCGYIKILMVNDGSIDKTLTILQKEKIDYICNEKNRGYYKTLQNGIRYACENRYEYVITFDADRQHKASEIEKLIKKMNETEADLVIGSRYLEKGKEDKNKIQILGRKLSTLFLKKNFKKELTDTTSGFRCMNRKVMKRILQKEEINCLELSFIVGLLKNNYKVEEVSIEMGKREHGISMFHGVRKQLKYVKTVVVETIREMREEKCQY